MTPQEFSTGWKFLINQPWGWRYKTVTAEGKPSEESKLQLEFYYSQLSFGHPDAWMKTAQLYAAGSEWPSLGSLRDTLSMFHRRCLTRLTDQTPDTGIPMPEEIRQKLQADGILRSMPTVVNED